jgi:hypothetical protein
MFGFLRNQVKFYSDVAEEHTTYPPFLGNNPVQVHATVIWKEEWVIQYDWGDSGQSELQKGRRVRACTKPHRPTTHKVTTLYSHQDYQFNKDIPTEYN